MAERAEPSRIRQRLRKIGITTSAVGGLVGVVIILAGVCNARASSESSSSSNLHGYGYDIDASALGPNILRVSSRDTYLPMHNRLNNMNFALERLRIACGEFIEIEEATKREKNNEGVLVKYGSVTDRSACFPPLTTP